MHAMDIIINTFIFLLAVNLWTMFGWFIVCLLDDFEATESHLLTCFFWFLILFYWVKIKTEEYLDIVFK